MAQFLGGRSVARTRLETVLSRIFDIGDLSARAFQSQSTRQKNIYGARVRKHVRSTLEEFASAFIFTMGLRSLVGLVIGLMATFAATVGTYLLLEQNKLFAEQIQTIQDQALETLYLETFDTLEQDGASTPRAEARASLFFSRLPTPQRQAVGPEVSGLVDFGRCNQVKLQSVPDRVRGLLVLDLSPSVVPTRMIDLADYRSSQGDLAGAFLSSRVSRALLDDEVISRVGGTSASDSILTNDLAKRVSISSSSFANVTWPRMIAEESQIQDSCFDGSILSDASFELASLRNVSFESADLDRANFDQGKHVNVDFSDARMRGSNLDQTVLRNVQFKGTNLAFARFGSVDENLIFENVSFEGANLSGAVITEVREWQVIGLETACTHPRWPVCIEGQGVMDLSSGDQRCNANETPEILSEILDSFFASHADLSDHLERYNSCIRSESF